MSDNEIRNITNLVGRKYQDMISMPDGLIASLIVREFGSSGIANGLPAIKSYGTLNNLARYGHGYSQTESIGR
ncbi:MAG: hypothetical protein QXZ17_10415 [Nitrososphaerota archaeon]